ncbi:MAG: hypothetical protein ABIN94_09930 [Ferruginibacter sp.]
MRLIKAFLFGAIGLFIIITLFSLLIPFTVRVSRVIVINTLNPGELYGQVANFENWKKWHPIFTTDSATIYPQYSAGRRDSVYVILHRGKQINITRINADSVSVKFLLHAKGENDIENELYFTTLPQQQSVQVEWRVINRLKWYPWEKFYGIFLDKLTGPGYEAALQGLKTFIEKDAPPTKLLHQ